MLPSFEVAHVAYSQRRGGGPLASRYRCAAGPPEPTERASAGGIQPSQTRRAAVAPAPGGAACLAVLLEEAHLEALGDEIAMPPGIRARSGEGVHGPAAGLHPLRHRWTSLGPPVALAKAAHVRPLTSCSRSRRLGKSSASTAAWSARSCSSSKVCSVIPSKRTNRYGWSSLSSHSEKLVEVVETQGPEHPAANATGGCAPRVDQHRDVAGADPDLLASQFWERFSSVSRSHRAAVLSRTTVRPPRLRGLSYCCGRLANAWLSAFLWEGSASVAPLPDVSRWSLRRHGLGGLPVGRGAPCASQLLDGALWDTHRGTVTPFACISSRARRRKWVCAISSSKTMRNGGPGAVVVGGPGEEK